MNRPKLRSSVSVVKLKNNVVEFFLTNTRQQVRIKVYSDLILDLILQLDGTLTIDQLIEHFNMDEETTEYFIKFMKYLESKSIIKDNEGIVAEDYDRFRRVINFLEDFSCNNDDLLYMWSNIRNSNIVIIGLGAVGTWVSSLMVQSGVRKFILIDNDRVEISNLHRQFGYGETEIGMLKIDALEKRMKEYSRNIIVKKINRFIDEGLLEEILTERVDLIINCADKPNVDITSLWVGEYCMKHNIPHIIGGGYNLHISLMGQTIIPFESACVKCFEKGLAELNNIDTTNIKKLAIKNRKIGSFGPMCSIIASMTAMEAIKVLSKKIRPANLNRRGEFSIYSMNMTYNTIKKYANCPWCGEHGIYNK